MANQGQALISRWIEERCREIGGPIRSDGSDIAEFIRGEIRNLRVLAYVRAVARQSREENMPVLDELIVELKRWEDLPAMMKQAASELRHQRAPRAA
jgi:hypothetical protein